MATIPMTTGERIKRRRKQLGISANDLAERIGVNRSTIFRWEKGGIEKINAEAVNTLATVLQTSSAYLIGIIDDPDRQEDSLFTWQTDNSETTIDYDTPAIKAAEILLKYHVVSAPIHPLLILESMPNVLVLSFTELATNDGLDKQSIAEQYGSKNQDVVTYERIIGGKKNYLVAYNQRMPYDILQKSLARELGYIVLGNSSSSQEDVRMKEALCFSRHLLFPRQIIKALEEANIPFTVENLGSITGCYGRCIAGIQKMPGAKVPPDLNRLVKEQFAPFIEKIIRIHKNIVSCENTPINEFGTYMDNYEE